MTDSPGFERVTRLVVRLLGVPSAFVTVSDGRNLHFQGRDGSEPDADVLAGAVALDASFCRFVVAEGRAVAIEDTASDPRTIEGGYAERDGIGAYLGVPVADAFEGESCTLCAVDHEPRRWTATERRIMAELADMLRTELELRADIRAHSVERHRTVLMVREMEHRVKNSLSTVQAMIAMSLKGQPVPEPIRSALLDRVASLARTHTLMMDGGGSATSFEALLNAELDHYAAPETIRLEGPEVRLMGSEAVTIGMVLHELATNAAKYGAFSKGGKGRLDVTWGLVAGEAGEKRLRFEWRERVPGREAKAPVADGFGTALLDTLIVHQQDGSIDRRWRADGLALTAELEISGERA